MKIHDPFGEVGASIPRPPHQPADEVARAGRVGFFDDTFPETTAVAPLSATPFRWIDPCAIPPRQWLYDRHYIRKFATATVAPGGLGKSSLAIVEALAMVTGRPLLGCPVREPLRVWIFNGEDPREELERRIAAACLQHGITADDIGGRLFIDSGRDTPFLLVERKGDRAMVVPGNDARLRDALQQRRIDVLIIDPFVSFHSVSENDNGAIDFTTKAFGRIAGEADAAIDLVHHVRKLAGGQGSYTIEDVRGGSSLIGAVRSARVLNGMSGEEASQAGVAEDNRGSYFRIGGLAASKANMAPRLAKAAWRRLVSVDLGNQRGDWPSDHVGVVTSWVLPGSMDAVTVEDMHAVRRLAASGRYRADPQAGDWIGHAVAEVLGLDGSEPSEKLKIKAILSTWLKSGALRKEMRLDASRRMRPYVVPGSFEDEPPPPQK